MCSLKTIANPLNTKNRSIEEVEPLSLEGRQLKSQNNNKKKKYMTDEISYYFQSL